jgi:hypothetical protein
MEQLCIIVCHVHENQQQSVHYLFQLYKNKMRFLIERFVAIASSLRKGFGLSLFGFDVIVPNGISSHGEPEDDDQYVVIDVNFFPSYKEVGDFPSRLRAFLRRRAGMSPPTSGDEPIESSIRGNS